MDGKIYMKKQATSKPKQIRNKSELITSETADTEDTGSASTSGSTTTTDDDAATVMH